MSDRHPIAAARERAGKSQEALGVELGVDALTISRWERGKNLPNRRYWPKIEALTKQPISEILAAVRREPAE